MENNRCNYNDRAQDRNYQNRVRAEREELGSIVQNGGHCCEHAHHMTEHCCATNNPTWLVIMFVLIGIFVLHDH